MCFGEAGSVVGKHMKEFKTLTKYLHKECPTEPSLDLISCRVKGEGLIRGPWWGWGGMKPVIHAAI